MNRNGVDDLARGQVDNDDIADLGRGGGAPRASPKAGGPDEGLLGHGVDPDRPNGRGGLKT